MRYPDEEPGEWTDDRDRYERERDVSGCEFCGHPDHPTKDCPVNPDSHIRRMTRHAERDQLAGPCGPVGV